MPASAPENSSPDPEDPFELSNMAVASAEAGDLFNPAAALGVSAPSQEETNLLAADQPGTFPTLSRMCI